MINIKPLIILSGLLGCASVTSRPVVPTAPTAQSATPPKADTGKIKPYIKVVPATAITHTGLFKTHKVGDKLYFEIPQRELNKDMLLVGRFSRGADESSLAGRRFESRTLRWERMGNRIILRSPSYLVVADSTLPVYKAVAASNVASILAMFEIEAYGADSSAVVDVTRLYTTATPGFVSIPGQLDEKRSFVERAAAFPDNVEVEASQTITPPHIHPGDLPPTALSIVAHWSMVRLPKKLMVPRRFDERVGYIPIESKIDYGTNEQRAATKTYIARFRLEKKDPLAAKSDPIKPIVYYLDPAIPDEWKPWVRKGVLEWQAAFEAAGFTNAIIPADPPVNDPDWSLEDVRNTVVRWLPSAQKNAYAEVTGLQDPRTGETLNGSVFIYHNILSILRNWYFTQVGPLDPRAHSMIFPDSLMGRLLQYIIAHEVGHAVGLWHDQLGSSLYPADSVRSRTWVARMGHTPSLMDYSRFNYVAQPEDSIALADLVPRVGPYDVFAVRWGYTPIPHARTSDEERPTLDRWAMEQDSVPWLRWVYDTTGTASEYFEAVGDADPVWSTRWGLKNLERVIRLLPRVAIRPGEDNSDLMDLYAGYTGVLGQWNMEMWHVVSVVGGSYVQPKSGSQPGAVYTPYSREKQRAAVKFLNDNAFKTPTFLINRDIVRRFETTGMVKRIHSAQFAVLGRLLDNRRMAHLVDFDALASNSKEIYQLNEMLSDVRRGIWTELSDTRVGIDAYRRALQISYIDLVEHKVTAPTSSRLTPTARYANPPVPIDAIAALRGELAAIRAGIRSAIPRTSDRMTKSHLQTADFRITNILEPK